MQIRSISLIAAVLAATALALPAAASADSCPPGQEGTPPYCKPITPTLKVKVKKANPSGVVLAVTVNLPGKVKVAGKPIKNKTASVQAGTSRIKVLLTKKAKKKLQKKGKIKFKLTVTFTPTNGAPPVTKKVKVTIKKHQNKKHKRHHRSHRRHHSRH
jgi:hypothetical protein